MKPDKNGYFGDFGGAYIPELLYPNVEELRNAYEHYVREESFQKEFRALLKDYVGRPTPLYHASRLSEKYNADIYLKREDLCHTGAHKINNTIGQILLAKRMGKQHIIAETGAGQHGVATATACALLNLKCTVFMGEKDIERQAPNVSRMKMLGADIIPARSGSKTLKDATNEAIRYWINHVNDCYYLIGSVVGPHPYPEMVAYFQSVISEEIKMQINDKPDLIIACVGGGSNAMGAFYHFIDTSTELVGVEAAGHGVDTNMTAATLHCGTEGILHASKSYVMQTEDGQLIEPYSISAGLDYPGIGPQHAALFKSGRAKYVAVTDNEALDAAKELAQLEGILPALESSHALAYLNKHENIQNRKVVVNLSGRGDKDMSSYIKYLQL